MSQVTIVTSPFLDEDIQFFYEAALDKKNKKLSLKIYNHRGVLKNRRFLKIHNDVTELFTAEEYLIGLNETHQKICIIDVRRIHDPLVAGEINSHNGLSEEMKKTNPKFTLFYNDRQNKMIFGVLDSKHVFYFRIRQFDNANELNSINLNNRKNPNQNLIINKIHSSSESISKLEVRNNKVFKKSQQKSPKKSLVLKVVDEEKQIPRGRNNNKIHQQPQYETISMICLLIKQKRLMRTIKMDWSNNKSEVQQVQNVHDFCFRNGWDFVLTYPIQQNQKRSPKKRQQSQQLCFKTSIKGNYQGQIKFTETYQIFCSEETLLLIDHEERKLIGVHNKQFRSIQSCDSIPSSINLSNTMLLIERPDQLYLRFLFEVYDVNKGDFDNISIMVPLFMIQQLFEEELYLKKNIQKVFCANGFIHPHFIGKVKTFLEKIEKKQSDSSYPNSSIEQSENKMSLREEIDIEERCWNDQDPSIIAEYFFQRFVFRDANLLNRCVFSLINYGVKELFYDKTYSKSPKNSIHNSKLGSLSGHAQMVNSKKQGSSNQFGCNFDRWNDYFEALIFEHFYSLKSLLKQATTKEKVQNQNENENKAIRFFQDLNTTKTNLSQINNFYSRILAFLNTSDVTGFDDQTMEDILNYYEQKIKVNMNRTQSIFLIYDLFSISTLIFNDRTEFKKRFQVIQQAIDQVFRKFQKLRIDNIKNYQKSANSTTSNKQNNHCKAFPVLMLHELFSNASQLNILNSKPTLQSTLEYLLSNIDSFEEVAYIYFNITVELDIMLAEEQKQEEKEDTFKNVSKITEERGSKIQGNNRSLIMENQSEMPYPLYPYITKDLINFFIQVGQIQDSQIQKQKRKGSFSKQQHITKVSIMVSKLKVKSFSLYMIQVCALHNLPTVLIKLIDSIKMEPYTISTTNSRPKNDIKQTKLQISKNFVQSEIMIIKSLIHCAQISDHNKYTNTLRQIIFYGLKRILSIEYSVSQDMKRHQIGSSKQIIINQSGNDAPEGVKPRNHLLRVFIQNVMSSLNGHTHRLIHDFQTECLTSEEDREFIQGVIEKEFPLQKQAIAANKTEKTEIKVQ